MELNMTRSAASLAACAVLITALPATALTPALPNQTRARTTEDHAQSLPVRRIFLYKNGVGFFEHIGTVNGSQRVTIDFTTAQLNDVLQTLTAVDLGGGRIIGAGYNSTTPLDQQLKSLPLSLSSNPTAADFYQAIRGARVEVTGAGAITTGRILNIELRATTPPKNSDDNTPTTQKHVLTVISDTGAVRSIELNSNTAVRLLDPDLHGDVNRYLQVLAANHQDGLRHLTLADNGTGTRELRVSYISEVPIWKSTYRILFDHKPAATGESETATLQGWAVVEIITDPKTISCFLKNFPLAIPFLTESENIAGLVDKRSRYFADGKIAEHWVELSVLQLLQQIGAIAAPGGR